MRKKLLLGLLFATMGASAQTTHMVPWFMGVSSSETTITIDAGDTVTWTWDDTAPHTVTSQAGGAESFNSGTLTGSNEEYSHTFTEVGSTGYACNFHPSMQGTIAVQSVASTEGNEITKLQYFPNPVTDVLTITAGEIIDRVVVYDMTGRAVIDAVSSTATVKIYMNNFQSGSYIVKAFSQSATKSMTIVKL